MFKINLSSYNIVGGIMLEFIMKYWIEFSFGLVISFITFLCKRINYYYKVMNSTKNGVKVLLKGEIIRRYNEYKKIGCLCCICSHMICRNSSSNICNILIDLFYFLHGNLQYICSIFYPIFAYLSIKTYLLCCVLSIYSTVIP